MFLIHVLFHSVFLMHILQELLLQDVYRMPFHNMKGPWNKLPLFPRSVPHSARMMSDGIR